MHVKRKLRSSDEFCSTVCYTDLIPKLDGHYLFRDYETTLRSIRIANSHTSRSGAPLYALWILSEHVEDLIGILQLYLIGEAYTCRSTGKWRKTDEAMLCDV